MASGSGKGGGGGLGKGSGKGNRNSSAKKRGVRASHINRQERQIANFREFGF